MSDEARSRQPRRPAAFGIEEPRTPGRAGVQDKPARPEPPPRAPKAVAADVAIVPDEEDPFIGVDPADDPAGGMEDLEAPLQPVEPRRRRRFSFGKIAAAAFGAVFTIAVGVWIDDLVRALFARAPWLAWTTLALVGIGVLALLVAIGREVIAIARLNAVQDLKQSVVEAAGERSADKARAATDGVARLLSHRPETAAGRATLDDLEGEIIDGPALVDLAETELLAPLDREARRLILATSKRVSVVTAVSPRAVVDLAYVAYEAARLIRAMATLYGGRPGAFGMIRLVRDTIAHLAVTGSIAVGDGIVQQILGHGVAARLSQRLGEGVINGMMTARIGIAAMDLCRPMPFRALKRPRIGDFAGDLARISGTGAERNRRRKQPET